MFNGPTQGRNAAAIQDRRVGGVAPEEGFGVRQGRFYFFGRLNVVLLPIHDRNVAKCQGDDVIP